MSNFRVSRCGNKFKGNDFNPPSREQQNSGAMSISTLETNSAYQRVNSSYKQPDIDINCSCKGWYSIFNPWLM